MKILVVSDNHGELEPLRTIIHQGHYDYLFHAGDYCCEVQQLKKLHPNCYFCLGNNDLSADQAALNFTNSYFDQSEHILVVELNNVRIGLIHGHYQLGWYGMQKHVFEKLVDCYQLDLLIFGHTHQQVVWTYHDGLILNPGSINYPRSQTNYYQKLNYWQNYAEVIIDDHGKISVSLCAWKLAR